MTDDRRVQFVSLNEVLEHLDPDRHVKKAGAAEYLGISVRYVEQHLDRLPHFRLPSGVILFRVSELREWVDQHRVSEERVDVGDVVDDVIADLREAGR